MGEYTPTTETIRNNYSSPWHETSEFTSEQASEEFDRWLAAHDAEARAEAESDPAKDERMVRYMAMATPLGYQSALTVVQEMTKLIDAETRARGVVAEEPSDQVKQLLRDMTDPDNCWFDHHGGCQAHGYLSLQPGEKCPHAEAKELLASWVPAKQEGATS